MRPLALSSEQFKAVKSILTHCWSNVVHHQFPHAESSFSTSISRRTEHPKGKTSFTKHALQLHQIAFPEERKWGNEALYKLLWVLLSNSSMRSLCYFAVSALHVFIWPSVKSVSGIMVLILHIAAVVYNILRQAPMICSTATKNAILQPFHHTRLTLAQCFIYEVSELP